MSGDWITRRQVALGGGVVIPALLASACAPGAAAPPAKKAPVKFSFWNARAFGPMEEKLISIYQEKNPHVTVEYVEAAKQGVTGSDAEQVNQLIIRATAGGTLDIAKVEASRVPFALWARKAILPLKKFGGDKAAANLLNTQLMNFAGDTWSLTYEASVRGLTYSGTAFKTAGLDPDKPPQTWEQVVAAGARLAKPPDKYAYIFPINNLFKTLDQVWMNGGDIFDRVYLPTKATFTRPEVQQVYEFQFDLVHKYGISPDKGISNALLSGAVAMEYGDASNAPAYRARQPEADWRVVKMFRQKDANPCYSAAAGSGLVLFTSSQAPEAAADYMKWLVSEDVQRIHSLITPAGLTMEQVGTIGIFPGYKKVATDPYWDTNPLVKGMNNCVTGIRAAAMSPIFTEVNTLLSKMQVDVIAKKVGAKDALGEAQRQAQAMLDADMQQNKELYATAK
ncbi:MAG: extracellular solute-binding protein [Chloroflexi bacterium]|nr:extracellular solute-binding protein [Chloroflexota bacterium]